MCFDASVLVKYWLNEVNSDRSRRLVNQAIEQAIPIWAPLHTRLEVANVFHQRWRQGQLETDLVKEYTAELGAMPLRVDDRRDRLETAVAMAMEWELPSIYDALYCSVSKHHDAVLWTADQRLIRQAKEHVEWVKPLQDADSGSQL